MRLTWLPKIAGLAVGVLLATWIAGLAHPTAPAAPVTGGILSECDGQLDRIAIQYAGGMDFVWPVYRQFLRDLPTAVQVVLVCPGATEKDELLGAVGQPASRFTIVYTNHPMTTWSRDRWLTFAARSASGLTSLVAPQTEAAADVWPDRHGDERLAMDLAAALPDVTARRSPLAFDGGDFLADSSTVFVAPAVLERNLNRVVQSEEELTAEVKKLIGEKRLIFLRNAPPHHVGMYMAITRDGEAIVGDPSLGHGLFNPTAKAQPTAIDSDWSLTTQRQFDDVADQVRAAGYRVRRIPTVVAPDGKTYLTYVNGLIDQRDGHRTFYLPVYKGQDDMNRAATQVWESVGYQVRPITCTSVFPHFGTLHCLVNVLKRS